MAWKIVADSSADVSKDFKPKGDTTFEEVPLTMIVGPKEFVDNHDLDVEELIQAIDEYPEASTSSCPTPDSYKKAFEEENADKIIAVTISSGLSGSYNSAQLAKSLVQEKMPEKEIHIVDSLGTSGTELLIVNKADELISQGLSFDEVVEELEKYRDSLEILYTLGRFENLVKNGRMNKIVGKIIQKFKIRIIGIGNNGTIKILYKVRGEAQAIKKLVQEMGKLKDMDGVDVIIGHTMNMPGAVTMKHYIEKIYPNVGSITIIESGGLNSYYAEEEGLIVSF